MPIIQTTAGRIPGDDKRKIEMEQIGKTNGYILAKDLKFEEVRNRVLDIAKSVYLAALSGSHFEGGESEFIRQQIKNGSKHSTASYLKVLPLMRQQGFFKSEPLAVVNKQKIVTRFVWLVGAPDIFMAEKIVPLYLERGRRYSKVARDNAKEKELRKASLSELLRRFTDEELGRVIRTAFENL